MPSTITPNMLLIVPTVGTEPGPDYATDVNSDLSLIDTHDHSSGKGVPITSSGININADLSFNNYNATTLKSIRFTSQAAVLSGGSDLNNLYFLNNSPVFNNGAGTALIPILIPQSLSVSAGDMFYATSSTAFTRLAIGSNGQSLKVSGGLPSWQTASSTVTVSSKTANYTLTSTDDVILGDSSGGTFTLTLPLAGANSGKVFRIKKTDSSVTAISIARSGGDAIDQGTSYSLNTQNEEIELISDGNTTWQITSHRVPYVAVSYTPTIVGLGTVSNVSFRYRRLGDSLDILGFFTVGTPTAVTATISLPAGLSINTSATSIPGNDQSNLGTFGVAANSSTPFAQDSMGFMGYNSTSGATVLVFHQDGSGGTAVAEVGNAGLFASGNGVLVRAVVPISGWNG